MSTKRKRNDRRASAPSALGRVVGMLAHTELASTDPAATRSFIEKVFSWDLEDIETPSGKLVRYSTPGGARGSIRATNKGEQPAVVNYVLVEDIRSTLDKVRGAGGEVIMPVVEVPQMGSFFWFKVPGGPLLAAWQDPPSVASASPQTSERRAAHRRPLLSRKSSHRRRDTIRR